MKGEEIINQHIKVIELVKKNCLKSIEDFAGQCIKTLNCNGTIFFMGNGGSAGDSQHIAAEFVGRFQKERKGYPAIALTTDTSIMTAIANDYGFDNIFRRQVEALVKKNDIVVGISTSGNSNNVIKGIFEAKKLGAYTIGLLGKDGGELKGICDLSIVVPFDVTARVQEAHILIGHVVCELVEEVLVNE